MYTSFVTFKQARTAIPGRASHSRRWSLDLPLSITSLSVEYLTHCRGCPVEKFSGLRFQQSIKRHVTESKRHLQRVHPSGAKWKGACCVVASCSGAKERPLFCINSRRSFMKKTATPIEELHRRQERPLITPTDLSPSGVKDISAAMNGILADVFALYLKTKN